MSGASEIVPGESTTGVSAPHKKPPQKILIVRLGAMGDIVHALWAAHILKGSFPNAEFGWVVEKRWCELLAWQWDGRHFPGKLHEVETRRWRKNLTSAKTIHEIRTAVHELRDEKYDVAVDFQGAIKSALICQLSGARRRYGFAEAWEKPASLFYTHPIHVTERHVVSRNWGLALHVIARERGEFHGGFYTFQLREDQRPWADQEVARLKLSEKFAILNPGAGWGAKQWPVERYAEVARELGAEGVRSLVNYGPGEEALAKHVEQNSGGRAVAASFTIAQLMAITQKASLFVGGDTGPLHLAAFLNIPVIAIFGPTDPARTGPYCENKIVFRDPASITSHKRRKEAEAGLLNITAAEVIAAARELLQINGSGVQA